MAINLGVTRYDAGEFHTHSRPQPAFSRGRIIVMDTLRSLVEDSGRAGRLLNFPLTLCDYFVNQCTNRNLSSNYGQ